MTLAMAKALPSAVECTLRYCRARCHPGDWSYRSVERIPMVVFGDDTEGDRSTILGRVLKNIRAGSTGHY